MTPTEAVSMLEKAWQENKRLRQENATITAERDEARQRLCDIVVLVEAEQDQRTSKKHGHDISMLTSVKVVTTFLMTPEFVEDLYRVNKQYEHIGSIVAQTLKNAVDQKQGTDIRSIAIVRPMIARSLA
jgi:phosphotransacetylase